MNTHAKKIAKAIGMVAFAVIKFAFKVIFGLISFIFEVIADAIVMGLSSGHPPAPIPAPKPRFDSQDPNGSMSRIQFQQQFGRIPNDNRG